MIKGVNRQVLEIHDTGNDYFEKALFFVKPEYSTINERKLHEQALQSLKSPATVPKTRQKKLKSIFFRIFSMLAAAGTGALLTMFIK